MHAPRYVVFAMLDEAKGTKETLGFATGGWVAAPVVGAVVRRIAPVLGLRPINQADAVRKALSIEISGKPGRERRVASH
jgi:cell division protein FtsI (penicillin-binding protein 3)